MNAIDARALLEDGTQWQADPALTIAEIDRLLARARVVDINRVLPGESGYIDTWTVASVNAQIAEGWTMKAGRIAGAAFDVKAGDVEAKRSQRVSSLASQARRYRGGRIGSITITTGNLLP